MKKLSGAGMVFMQKLLAEEQAKKEREKAQAALLMLPPNAITKTADYQRTEYVTDEWLKKREQIRAANSGVTFVRDTDGSPKVMSLGDGLELFTGKFKDLNQFKGPVHVGEVNLPHHPKIPLEQVKKLNQKAFEKVAFTFQDLYKTVKHLKEKNVKILRDPKDFMKGIKEFIIKHHPELQKEVADLDKTPVLDLGLSMPTTQTAYIQRQKSTQNPYLVIGAHEYGHLADPVQAKMSIDQMSERTPISTIAYEHSANNYARDLIKQFSSTPEKDIEIYNNYTNKALKTYKNIGMSDAILQEIPDIDKQYSLVQNASAASQKLTDPNVNLDDYITNIKSIIRHHRKKNKLDKKFKKFMSENKDIFKLKEE